ncbi:MAG: hypothetical protein FWD91_01315 [Treponema sp.]|nr:hypothetical protein [Treponema sp.]
MSSTVNNTFDIETLESPDMPDTSTTASSSAAVSVVDIIKLLDYLQDMIKMLSQEDQDFYVQSNFPQSVQLVIDSLTNIATMGDRDGSRF